MDKICQKLLARFLDESNHDDISLLEVSTGLIDALHFDRLRLTMEQGKQLWDATCALVTLLLQNGFVIGDIGDNGKCVYWPNQEPVRVIERIAEKYKTNESNIAGVQFTIWFHKPLDSGTE